MQRAWLWLVPLLGLAEWAAHAGFAGRAPDLAEWQAVAPQVQSWRAADELIVVSPAWAEPNARLALGDALMPVAHVARPELQRYATVLEVSLLGQTAPALEQGYQLVEERSVGRFELRRWQSTSPVQVHFDFVQAVGPEGLSVLQGEQGQACRWSTRAPVSNGALFGHPTFPHERFRCAGGDWAFVGVTVIDDEQYRPRRCVWAHPSGGGLRLKYAEVPLGTQLRGYGGLPYFTSRDGKGTPVRLEAFVDGDPIGSYEHRDGEGWTRFEFDTRPWQGQRHAVEFRISSQKLARREFCFYADTRSPASGDGA